MIRPRSTLRRGEPTTEEKQQARISCRERVVGMCESGESPQCLVGPLPLDGDLFTRGHLAHLHSKRRFGWMEDGIQRHRWFCYWCHAWEHNGGKPVPSKFTEAIMKSIAALILAGATLLSAQTVTPKPPVLTDAQKLAFFKASSEYQGASLNAQNATQVAQQKQAALQEAVKAITDACGKDFAPTMDAAGNPVCGAKDVKK